MTRDAEASGRSAAEADSAHEEQGGPPPGAPGVRFLTAVCGAVIVLASVGWALQLHSRLFGLALHTPQFLSVVLGAAAIAVFATRPLRRRPDGRPGPEDWALAIAAGATFAYVGWNYERLLFDLPYRTPELLAVALVLLVVVLEALRRAAGWSLFLIVLASILYGTVGHMVPGVLSTREVALDRLAIYLSMDLSALFGSATTVGATVVILYILLGQLLLRAGGGEFFTDLATAAVGNRRGGPAKVAVVGSALFGSISGSAVSNVASTGMVTIPLMRRAGYGPERAGAIEAVASTGGQLTPPIMGAAAFLVAEFLSLPYSTVALAAVIPAGLYYWALFAFIDLSADREGIGAGAAEPAAGGGAESPWRTLADGWQFVLPFAALFVALFHYREGAQTAALIAAAVLLFASAARSYRGRRMSPGNLWAAVVEAGLAVVPLMMILAGAGFLIGVLNLTGLGFALTLALLDLAGGALLPLLLVAAVSCVILGMGMPTSGVYLLLATLIAPAIVEAGVEPIAAHLFVLYFGLMSMITPPVAIAAFAAASITGASAMRTGWAAMRLGWVAYVIPFMFAFSPTLVMVGSPLAIGLNTVTAVAGVYFVTVAAVGWFAGSLGLGLRGIAGICGVATIVPDTLLGVHHVLDGGGLLVGGGLLFARLMRRRSRTKSGEGSVRRTAH